MQWLKRIGVLGFLFFLVKGLLWLCIPAAIMLFDGCSDTDSASVPDSAEVVETSPEPAAASAVEMN